MDSAVQLASALLDPIFSGRCFTNAFSESGFAPSVTPACRISVTNSTAMSSICGSNDESTDDVTLQIDIVADNYADMIAARRSSIAAFRGDSHVWQRGSISETFDSATKRHRCFFDMTLHLSGSGD